MSAFFDATCPKCGKRFGWGGTVVDRPPCPGCGHTVARADLESDEAELKAFEEFLLRRRKKRKGDTDGDDEGP